MISSGNLIQNVRLVLGLVVALNLYGQAPRQTSLRSISQSIEQVVDQISPAVVQISAQGFSRAEDAASSRVRTQRGTGSGVILDPEGYIVTNAHVVGSSLLIQVLIPEKDAEGKYRSILKPVGKVVPATVVGQDRETDIAVLKVAASALPALKLADSERLRQGELVLAAGSPFGLQNTVTMGVVSSIARQVRPDDPMVYIQTDASINPGNSGGPLLDSAGRLIGVNTSIYSPSGASAGIGFAIPADTVNRVVPEIIAFGRYERAVLGIVSTDNLSDPVTRQLGVRGMLIVEVQPRSPAADAGLRGTRIARDGSVDPGDVIQSVDGKPVAEIADFDRLMDDKRPGDRVTLGLWREGRTLSVTIRLGRR